MVVVDDSEAVRRKLRGLLVSNGFEVAGEAADGAASMGVIAEAKPDVVIMDLKMPGMSGIEATWQLGSIGPDAQVLIFTVSDDEDDLADAVMAGAKGYVLKGAPDEEIADAVRSVAAGKSLISPAVARDLVQRSAGIIPAAPLESSRSVEPPQSGRGPDSADLAEVSASRARSSSTEAAVVALAGVVLTALGQAPEILDGDATLGTWIRAALNFAVAYVVWRLGVLAGRRAPSG